jgi:chromosome segregation ATPase
MAHSEKISTLRRGRSVLLGRFTHTAHQLDEYEQSGQPDRNLLMSYRKSFDDVWSKINSVQEELEDLDEDKNARVESLLREYHTLDARIIGLMDSVHPSTWSKPSKR